jgi:hypothetical protein
MITTVSKMEAKQAGRRAKRQFTDEFKAGAVRLVLDEGKPYFDGGGLQPSNRQLSLYSARMVT